MQIETRLCDQLSRYLDMAVSETKLTAANMANIDTPGYPPIDLLDSISRLMPAVAQRDHREQAALFRRLMAAYARSEDLVRIGAYKPGADPDLDRALHARSTMREFMMQNPTEHVGYAECLRRLAMLVEEI